MIKIWLSATIMMVIEQWAKDYWKSNLPLTQNYKDFMKPYLNRLAFKKIKAHIGIFGNELADKLAKGQIEDLDIPDDKNRTDIVKIIYVLIR